MDGRDYYDVLGVPKTATPDEIKAAYRTLARKLHPDVNKAPDAQERFSALQRAYEVLSDQEARATYDRVGHAAYVRDGAGAHAGAQARWSAGPEHDLGDLFETFFGGRSSGFGTPFGGAPRGRAQKRAARGEDLHHTLEVDFDTAVRGGARAIAIERGGAKRTITVTIPAGVADDAKLRIRGEGHPAGGRPGSSAGRPGDLILRIRVRPSPIFRRGARPGDERADSLDLWLDLPLTIGEATLGAKVDVPTVDGPVAVTVPPGTSGGRRLRLAGRGIDDGKGRRGDVFAICRIVVPAAEQLDDADRAALERLSSKTGAPRAGPGFEGASG